MAPGTSESVRDRVVELRRVPAAELRANPKNWRRHPRGQVRALTSVLQQVGYADALLARETPEGLELIDGHLRAEVTPEQEVPVLVLDVNQQEADLILATLDPLAAMAEADTEALEALLESVAIDSADLAEHLAGYVGNGQKEGLTDPDEVPPLPAEPTTKPGDLWLLGGHRLLCGDATNSEAQARLLVEADGLLVTDPPYGVSYSEIVDGRGNQKAGGWRAIANDGLKGDALEELLRAAFEPSKAGTALVWFGHEQRFHVERALEAVGFSIAQEIIWVKSALVMSRGADYHWRHEQAAYAKRKGHRPPPTRDQDTVWEVDKQTASLHPTQKPVELYRIPLRNHTKIGEWAYDPFAGSGTLAIAAEELGRRAMLMDIDPLYCDLAVRRWENFTGKTAELAT